MAEQVHRLIYRSHSTVPGDRRDEVLAEIFDVARSKNKKAGVTGALLISDHWFVQALEGDEAVVTGLFETIREDDRHTEVSVVESTPVAGRVFSRWSMARISASGRSDIPLHDVDGRIRPAAPDQPDREQQELLTRMRNTIGADSV
ncbi:BLUF domain-containing protein [Pseudonocardia sp. HH130629-09]|uniref:BLUF domain-containing protein n=1 Tax=Pseudonocardia sp. HH130629-09 TaxID=1641402 RepID=UPI000761A0B3|nr:BLUF domain-containing protein [Pseudonocardia sp. HH130629-09]